MGSQISSSRHSDPSFASKIKQQCFRINPLLATVLLALTSNVQAHSSMPRDTTPTLTLCSSDREYARECVGNFQEGLAQIGAYVTQDGERVVRMGYFDQHGKVVIPPKFFQVKDFHQGLAAVRDDRYLWGYIKPNGEWAMEPQFDEALDFDQSKTALVKKNKQTLLIDTTGKVIREFASGSSPVDVLPSDATVHVVQVKTPIVLWHVQDGRVLKLPPEVREIGQMRNGWINAKTDDGWGLIDDRTGQWITRPEALKQHLKIQTEEDGSPSTLSDQQPILGEGVIAIAHQYFAWQFVDVHGKLLNESSFNSVERIQDRFWWVKTKDKSWLMDDRLHTLAGIPADNDFEKVDTNDATHFVMKDQILTIPSQGEISSLDLKNAKWDSRFRAVWYLKKPQKSSKDRDEDDDIQLEKYSKVYFLDSKVEVNLSAPNGSSLANYSFDKLRFYDDSDQGDFPYPIAELKPQDSEKNPIGLITASGKVVFNPDWKNIDTYRIQSGVLEAETHDGLTGLLDAEGQWKIEPRFSYFKLIQKGSYALAKEPGQETWQVFDMTNSKWIAKISAEQLEQLNLDYKKHQSGTPIPTDIRDERTRRYQQGLWDLENGKLISDVTFEKITGFTRGYAVAKHQKRWGIINSKGQWVVQPQYNNQDDIRLIDDYAYLSLTSSPDSVSEKNYKLIRLADGKTLSDQLTKVPKAYSNRYYAIQRVDGAALIDREGIVLDQVSHHEFSSLHRDDDDDYGRESKAKMSWLALGHEDFYGIVNAAGQWVLEPQKNSISSVDIQNGWVATFSDSKGEEWKDITGKNRFSQFPERMVIPSMGLAVVTKNNQEHQFINEKGQTIATWKQDERFTGEIEPTHGVFRQGDNYGWFDRSGQKILAARYESLHTMREGLALARLNMRSEKVGFVDATGRFSLPPRYDMASSFSEGLAFVQEGETFKYIDRSGQTKLSLKFVCGAWNVLTPQAEKEAPTKCPAK